MATMIEAFKNEIKEALNFSFVNRILLDNHTPHELSKAVDLIANKKLTEASGMITSKNLIEFAETGVDFISMGALSYDAKNIDMSLKAII